MERAPSQSRLSAVAVDSADVVLDERKMYAVEWRDGATFGFTVTPVSSDRGTVLLLARRTARREQLQVSGLQDVVPGDMLVAIGDEKVYHLGAEHAAKYLRSVPKPVRLTLQLSPYGNQSKQLPDLAPNEYHYLWEDGPLGIVLTYDTKSKLPMVKRLSDKANETVRRDVDVSDQLMYCNDVPTNEYSMDEVMSILREMPKPVLLRFRKQLQDDHLVELPELAENEYEFLWDYGPLGLVIGMSRSGLPFVRSFTGLGTSKQLNLVMEDDEIVMVNDKSAKEEGFRETMQYLMNVPKPAVLRFRRKSRNSMPSDQDRGSQAIRTTVSARPSTPGYQMPAVPDCEGPLSPVAPLGMSAQNFDDNQNGPLSPQVRVSIDRTRFRSVSSSNARSSAATEDRVSGPLLTSPSQQRAVSVRARPSAVTSLQTIPSPSDPQRGSDEEQFQDARGSHSSTGDRQSGDSDERETAILPPDPNASRGSIFTFQFESEVNRSPSPPGAAAEPPRQRRISARTGSMPPDPVVEPMARPDEHLVRSQSSRPVANTTDPTQTFVPLPDQPISQERASGPTAEKPPKESPAAPGQPEAASPTNARSSRGAKPTVDTAELVAEPGAKPVAEAVANPVVEPVAKPVVERVVEREVERAAKPVAKPTSQRGGSPVYLDTAELVADPTPVPAKASSVDNQRDVGTSAVIPPSPPVKAKPSPSKSNQIEDTAELVADPVPKKTAAAKSYVDTADLVAEPAKPEKPMAVAKPKKEKEYIDTAELFAEPPKKEKAAPPAKKPAYEDTAELVADPPSKKKAYVDTADLVAVPAAAPKPKPAYIDTAELFAELTPVKPAVTATPASAPSPAAPTPAPAPAAAAPAQPKTAPAAAPAKPAAPAVEPLEYFTVDPDAFYTVQWTEGPFGSTVREADSNTGPVMLITKRTGKQTCRGLRRIAVGDLLVRIGDKDVSSMGFEKATRYLRKVPKPVPLTFMAVD
jgi:hypothetical protein